MNPDSAAADATEPNAAFLALVRAHYPIITKVVRLYAYEDADVDTTRDSSNQKTVSSNT